VVPVGGRCYSAVYAFLKAGNENEAGARAANTRGVEVGEKARLVLRNINFLFVCCTGLLCDICKHVIKHAELVLSLFFKHVIFYFRQNCMNLWCQFVLPIL